MFAGGNFHFHLHADFRWQVCAQARGNCFSKGGGGVKVKNQVLSCNMIHWLKSCWLLDRRSLPLLWHLSNISAICNFWPRLQILGGQLTRPSWPGLPWAPVYAQQIIDTYLLQIIINDRLVLMKVHQHVSDPAFYWDRAQLSKLLFVASWPISATWNISEALWAAWSLADISQLLVHWQTPYVETQ